MDGTLTRASLAGPCGFVSSASPVLSTLAPYRPCYSLTVPVGAQPEMRELLAIDTDAGTRLDRFVTAHCPELSRSRVQELVDGGLILVNGKPAKSSQKLRGGELITVASSQRG